MKGLTDLLASVGPEIDDADEESFLIFSEPIPSSNLGFLDSRAAAVDVSIHGQDYTVHQSPTLLSSARAGGTTGAVLWKITPPFAEWISSHQTNPLWTHSLLSSSSTVVELGCGISGLIALSLAPAVRHYIATDQEYVRRLLRQNLEVNASMRVSSGRARGGGGGKKMKQQQLKTKSKSSNSPAPGSDTNTNTNITFTTLDWETDIPSSLKDSIEVDLTQDSQDDNDPSEKEKEDDKGFDLLLSCDCIYNEALVSPFVRTCADICRLRPVYRADGADTPSSSNRPPTICLIAQQQRTPDVFETWLRETMRFFRVWRVSDQVLGERLRLGSGYLVHLLLLKEDVA